MDNKNNINFHQISCNQLMQLLGTGKNGLTTEEAGRRLQTYGKNKIKSKESVSMFKIFFRQFKTFLMLILIIAGIVSYFIGPSLGHGPLDSILIFSIILINAVFGFVQDYKAQKSIQALKKISAPKAVIIRDGKEIHINSENVVPGDLIKLSEGNKIPADCRVIESNEISVDESILTGESLPVSKKTSEIEDCPIAEMDNMVFKDTYIVRGNGLAIAITTGKHTETGKIATEISKIKEKSTPFQKELDSAGRTIGYFVLVIIIIIAFFQNIVTGIDLATTVLIAISLAIAAVPEGLPAVVTLTMAISARRMAIKNAIVRKLPVVESLGSVNIICTDKTGTLTKNKMTVEKIFSNGSSYILPEAPSEKIKDVIQCGYICNNASNNNGEYFGDPTEIALLVSTEFSNLKTDYEKLKEIPFSSERKMMSVVAIKKDKKIMYSKGAVETILSKCSKIRENGKDYEIDRIKIDEILKQQEEFSSSALRVLGFAVKEITTDESENNMIFVGMQAMMDPPRDGVKESVQKCKEAGIRTIMITGDNQLTAKAIAEKIGLGTRCMEGRQIDSIGVDELSKKINSVDIISRATPSNKVKILDALRIQKNIIVMTGDGINDAPALKNSDIGIAMGKKGTDVAKQASDMILIDDDFSTIVKAIEEGRNVFANVKKFVNYLLTSNFAEVLTVFLVSLIAFAYTGQALIPITAVQLLWINIMTDGIPALTIGLDPAEKNIMKKKPEQKKKIIDKEMLKSIIIIGGIISAASVSLFFITYSNQGIQAAQTIAFTSLVFYEIFRIISMRQKDDISMFKNKWLNIAIAGTLIIQLAVIYIPFNGMYIFNTVPLGVENWIHILIGGIIIYIFSLLLNTFQKKNKYLN